MSHPKIAHSPFTAEKKNLDLTKVPNPSGAFWEPGERHFSSHTPFTHKEKGEKLTLALVPFPP